MAAGYAMDVDDERSDDRNRHLVSFDLFAPTQHARAGEGVAVQLQISFERFDSAHPKVREVELRLDPRRSVTERCGFMEPVIVNGVSVQAKGVGRRPYWRIAAVNTSSLSDCNLEIGTPPLCRMREPLQGEELAATLVTYPDRFIDLEPSDITDLSGGADSVELVKQRIIERLRLKEFGEFAKDGEIVLGRLVSVVREIT
jgi:hypothetical protein